MLLKYNHPGKLLSLINMHDLSKPLFLGKLNPFRRLTSNQEVGQLIISFASRHTEPIYFSRPRRAGAHIFQAMSTYLQIISLGCTGWYEYDEYCPFRLLCWCSHAFTQSLYSINISINSARNLRSRRSRLVAIKIVCIKTGKGSETRK